MLNKVDIEKTTYTSVQIVKAFIEAWLQEFNELPSEDVIGVLYAQNSLETGYSKSMYNNNIGNIKAVDKSTITVNYFILPGTWEVLNGKKVVLSTENPGSRFLSFDDLKSGVMHHIRFLKQKRFSKAWDSVLSGDPRKFSLELKSQMYYTSDELTYTRNLVWIFDKYKKDKIYSKALEEVKVEPIYLNIPIVIEFPEENKIIKQQSWFESLILFIISLFKK